MKHLKLLLKEGTRFDPRYYPSMNSDHMPMTLCAIHGLGGDKQALESFRDDYSKRLSTISAAPPMAEWKDAIGVTSFYPALFAFFRERIAGNGAESVVAEYLPPFVASIAMEAFHPIIRLGFALDFGSDDEVAAALSYLITSFRETPIATTTSIDLKTALEEQVHAGPTEFRSVRFGENIVELVDNDAYPVGSASALSDCANLALDIYLGTRNFFALHLVTATQAVRICQKLIGEDKAVAALTGALLAAHKVLGSPGFMVPLPVPDQIDREHGLKYAWACLSEFQFYGDSRYVDEIRKFRSGGLIPEWSARKTLP